MIRIILFLSLFFFVKGTFKRVFEYNLVYHSNVSLNNLDDYGIINQTNI